MRPIGRCPVVACAAAVIAGTLALAPAAAADAGYTVNVNGTGAWAYPDDTPASVFTDADGKFYAEQAHSLYGATSPREWVFYHGRTLDDAKPVDAINKAVNPADPTDRNDDTTSRCNNSPTGVESTFAPAGSSYSERNYCDLTGMWVDPDTGDWYGLVHNEFTPQPFGDRLHYDAIDYAVSKDHGRTWTIKDHAITSPYSTKRGDDKAFPQDTYYYGDGDQRLLVDYASGYFYVFYGSRVVDKGGSWKAFYEHVARAPIAKKMARGSWQKFYDGKWSEPGIGGKESNQVPVDADHPTGYTAPKDEYDPSNPGTTDEQIKAGTMPPTSPLFVMDVAYDAHLGLYIGEPQNPDQSGNAPQEIYATDNLATQKWRKIGDTGDYKTASWYRWFLDDANGTSSSIVGKNLRMYCSYACSTTDGTTSDNEYAKVSIDTARPNVPIKSGSSVRISSGAGRTLVANGNGHVASVPAGQGTSWTFTRTADGSYTIRDGHHGFLGVDSTSDAGRAWGTPPRISGGKSPSVGQQWWVIANKSVHNGASTGDFRLVNRYSGLVLALTPDKARSAQTAPLRAWTDTSGTRRTAAEQTVTLKVS